MKKSLARLAAALFWLSSGTLGSALRSTRGGETLP